MSFDPLTLSVYYIVFLASTTVHEAAHAWVALLGGDETAYRGGQVSLNPLPHIQREPVGMVVLPIVSLFIAGWPFGFASAPYSPEWALRHPRRAAWMSLAGPASNLLMFVLAGLALRGGLALGVFTPPAGISFGHLVDGSGFWHAAGLFLGVTFSLNLLLGVFNLIPVPPLDGSGIAPLFLDAGTANRYQRWIWANQHLSMIGIVVAWQLIDRIWPPVRLFVVNVLYAGISHYG